VIGQRFGNYRALSLLGEGGMGAVYLAEHPDIGRRVAVKVLRPEMIKDPQLLQRFMNEARAANAIRHPNIIEILDSGTTPEGTPYLVMELLEGEVLSGRIRRLGKLPLVDALEFAYQTASALAAAHEKAIIHRDLKPDNLFIIRDPSDPSRERVKVLDFGIAKLQTMSTGPGSGGGMQTRTGTLMGTPVYMSPEQCLGTKTVDQRSDVYALGIIIFEMLSGRPPFLSEGFGELVNMHLNVKPPSLRQINPDVPAAVDTMVTKALEKAPEARQRSAAELQIDIRAAAGTTIVIRGASSPNLVGGTMPGAAAGVGRTLVSATTMSTGAGERFATTVPVQRQSSKRLLLLAAVVIVAIGGGVSFGLRGAGKDPATLSGAAKTDNTGSSGGTPATGTHIAERTASTSVRLTIDSTPSGAEMTEVGSGRSLGTTPGVVERVPTQGPITIRLEHPGFVTVTRTLTADHDRTETIALVALPPVVGADSAPHDRPAGKIKKKTHPPRPTARAEDEPAKL
jgi:tRNA A-37 threonylcarbamoyl transferase component Bud32